MASLGEVRQLVELGLGKAADAIAALEAAADLVDEAQALIRAASRGSGRADAAHHDDHQQHAFVCDTMSHAISEPFPTSSGGEVECEDGSGQVGDSDGGAGDPAQ
ncbi:hypothetical protein Q5530_11515 [Saccharothrix sp. BKS2]|uniref:hypothetical protein n=1 Tax=Saccharothrix sp. BKS2 TaxID=3064400 RepID=UPI0039E9E52D